MLHERMALGQVILVEDDPAVRGVLTLLLESEGWHVTEAADGKAGLLECVEVFESPCGQRVGLGTIGHGAVSVASPASSTSSSLKRAPIRARAASTSSFS